MKHYLYHRKPLDMTGKILCPLNQLKSTHPDLYTEKVKKYDGREFLLNRKIPLLDCLWNDVLHMSPVPPSQWKAAVTEAGMPDKKFTFFKIDPTSLDQELLAIYLFKELQRYRKDVPAEEFVPFAPEILERVSHVPEATKLYYKEMYERTERPLLFFGVPHILYKGEIDITNSETITV